MQLSEPQMRRFRQYYYTDLARRRSEVPGDVYHGRDVSEYDHGWEHDMVERGLLQELESGEFTVTAAGNELIREKDHGFSHFIIRISREEDSSDPQLHRDDPDNRVIWKADNIAMCNDRPMTRKAWRQAARVSSRHFKLDLCIRRAKLALTRSGFPEACIFLEITDELQTLADRQATHRKAEEEASNLRIQEEKATIKRAAGMSLNHVLMTPVDRLDLPPKITNALKKAGILVAGELVGRGRRYVLKLPRIGWKAVSAIDTALYHIKDQTGEPGKYRFDTDLPDWQIEEIERLKAELS